MNNQEAEIKAFYYSLTKEKETFTRPLICILNAQIIKTKQVDGAIIGTAGVINKTLFVCVKEGFQGRGIGRELIREVINESKKKGYERISLATKSNNRRAIALYKSLGFKNFRKDPMQGRIEMILPLTFKGILIMAIGRSAYIACYRNNDIWQRALVIVKKSFNRIY